jgi:hypothetical protein
LKPKEEIIKMLNFLEINYTNQTLEELAKLVIPPQSLGRHKSQNLSIFISEEIEHVKRLGFSISV